MILSLIIPTYNNEKTIKECLESIEKQDFDKRNFETLILDGGSTDKTLKIASKYKVKILNNPKRVEENARILGVKKAKGRIIGFIDADNILVGEDWINKMLKPFKDKEIIFADTLYFSSRKTDPIKVRYQALIGGDDSLVTFLGFYSRWCFFKKNWTDYPYNWDEKKDYFKVKLKNTQKVPAMGSNGFLVRKDILKKFFDDTFIHSDIIYDLVNNNYNCFAKVKTGIIHNQPTFFKNKIRRMKRRERKQVNIRYNYGITNFDLMRTSLRIALIIPLLIDMIKGYKEKPDLAWLFHLPACIGLLSIYAYYSIKIQLNSILFRKK